MINNKKLDELFHKKKEYLNIKTKDEMRDCISRDHEHNVISLKLELKKFTFFEEAKNVKKLMIYFGIYDNDTKEYLDYSTYSNVDIDEEIVLPKRATIVKKINTCLNFNANLSFKILVIPIKEENESFLFSLEKKLYLPDATNTNVENFLNTSKKILSFLYSKLLPLFIFVLIPANVYIYLIKNIGLVESLIDISTITTTVIYLLNGTINLLFENLLSFFIGGILFIPIYLLLVFFFTIYGFYILSKSFRFVKNIILCNSKNQYYEIFSEKITIKRFYYDLGPMIKSFLSTKYLYLYSLIYSLFVLFFTMVFFITQIVDANKNDINKINTVISITANEYIQYSAFPKLSSIKKKSKKAKSALVLFMGYDKTFSYYYDISYINEILSSYKKEEIKKFLKDYKENNKDKENIELKISFQDIFKAFLAGRIDNSNIKAIKNDMYEFYDINKFEITLDEFSKLKKMDNLFNNKK